MGGSVLRIGCGLRNGWNEVHDVKLAVVKGELAIFIASENAVLIVIPQSL